MSQQKKHGFKYHFARSTYITIAWNWFMMFAAAACEAILTVSVIYSCARLLPALHTPLWLDNTVFIWQMVALDVGGLSLRKMANQASRDGNESGAKFAGRVSNALITIMVLNVVLSVLQGVAKLDPQIVSVVEGILLVARAVMAVLYAAVIHSLREDTQESEASPPALFDSWALVGLAAYLQQETHRQLMELANAQSQKVNLVDSQVQRLLSEVQDLQELEPEPVDYQKLAVALGPLFEQRMNASVSAIKTTIIEEVRATLPMAPEPPQLETRASSQSQKSSGTRTTKKVDSEPVRGNGTKSPEDRLEAAFDWLMTNSIRVSGRALSTRAHVNRGTANAWLQKREQQSENGSDVVDSEPVE